jgi:hypothetical protein
VRQVDEFGKQSFLCGDLSLKETLPSALGPMKLSRSCSPVSLASSSAVVLLFAMLIWIEGWRAEKKAWPSSWR